MQNKGLIRVFAIIFGLVCIYQLSYTYITNTVENDAEAYAEARVDGNTPVDIQRKQDLRKAYLDSVGGEDIWGGYTTYTEAKSQELKKGLDLKGGINVILQISTRDLLEGLADGSKDPDFIAALNAADERVLDGQEDYFDYFLEEFNAIEGARLASPDIFANQDMDGIINFEMSNEEVSPILRDQLDDYMISAFEVLRKRIDKFGVTQPNIQRLGNSGRILIELPGAKDIKRITELLKTVAQLEFWHVVPAGELEQFMVEADQFASTMEKSNEEAEEQETDIADVSEQEETAVDTTAVAQEEPTDDLESILGEDGDIEDIVEDEEVDFTANPILGRMISGGSPRGPIVGIFKAADTALIGKYLRMPQVRAKLPADKRYTQFAWGQPLLDNELGYETSALYALENNRDDEPPLSGDVITNAKQDFDLSGDIVVSMSMDSEGARIWEEMTTEAFQDGTQIAVVLDNVVYSAPGITNGPIAGGRSQISGDFTLNEADDLANVLRAGKLPASADIIQSDVVGPSLGQEAINAGLISFLIALVLVLIWMVFYYGRAGLYADVALLVNILFIFGVLASLKAVLTLPGIAGIVLTIGISVDANVLIFERIREELAKGKSQVDSIRDGFNNALSSILDANITTFLTAAILFAFGTGPIQGFATTLMIGIATSLFTAIFITRLFIDGYGKNGKSLSFASGVTKNWFRNVDIAFLTKRKPAYIISAILLVISIGSLTIKGLNLGIDFTGGRTYTVRFEEPVNATEITQALSAEDVFGSAEAKTYGGENQLKISTKYGMDTDSGEMETEIETKLYNALVNYLPEGMDMETFADVGAEQKQYGIMSYFKVGPTIADDILKGSIYAIFGSLIVVFLYILFRFRKWQFSLGAVVAVFHDVIIVLGMFSLLYDLLPFNMEIDQAFIAAILTVIGYSLNDTVVVFDRIREFLAEKTNWAFMRTVDGAISSTISRTLNTSLTTLIVLLAICIFGGESIRGFMFALIIGVIVGTYSSVFIATPVMYDTLKKSSDKLRRKEVEAKAQKERNRKNREQKAREEAAS